MNAHSRKAGVGRVRPAACLLAISVGLAACGPVGPDFVEPETDLSPSFVAAAPAISGTLPPGTPWWRGFGDEILERLIAEGVAGNLEIDLARSRLREAHALVRARTGELLPDLDGSVSAFADWEDDGGGSRGRNGSGGGSGEGAVDLGAESALSLLWDPDLFGGGRRSVEAARAEAVRQAALRDEAKVMVASEIARIYVALRGAQRRLELTKESVSLQRRTLQLVRGRVEAGLAPGLDLSRAEGALAGELAELPPIAAEIDTAVNAIAVLSGKPPGSLRAVLEEPSPIPDMELAAPIGVPRDLLRRRPDLRAAEAALAGATAEVGVATAALYPRLTLPGSVGVELGDLASGSLVASVVASLAAVLDIPLLDGGTREANLDAAEERALQALLTYRQTLLGALQEVEAALIAQASARERRRALADAAAANERAYEQARALYAQGLASFLDVLDAQRVLTDSRLDLAEAEVEVSSQMIALYRRLGGSAPGPIAEGDRPRLAAREGR